MNDQRLEPKSKSRSAPDGGPPSPPKVTARGLGNGAREEVSRIRVTMSAPLERDVMSYLNLLSGVITNIALEANSKTTVAATLPKAHLDQFQKWFSGFSKGQGRITKELE